VEELRHALVSSREQARSDASEYERLRAERGEAKHESAGLLEELGRVRGELDADRATLAATVRRARLAAREAIGKAILRGCLPACRMLRAYFFLG
jgi:hypothetical protein